MSQAHRNGSFYQCCSGFCIDLLEKFSEELGFTYELVRVEDGRWGTLDSGKWNGLIADLVNRKTDMVMTSLMINSEREAVVSVLTKLISNHTVIIYHPFYKDSDLFKLAIWYNNEHYVLPYLSDIILRLFMSCLRKKTIQNKIVNSLLNIEKRRISSVLYQ